MEYERCYHPFEVDFVVDVVVAKSLVQLVKRLADLDDFGIVHVFRWPPCRHFVKMA